MTAKMPTQARVVIVGGGIIGCSVAYHLVKLGWRDVVLLESGKLTCGTTWHAAGLIGQTRPNRSMTRMSRYGIELYSQLENETGLATGWKRCGSVNVASTPERLIQLKRGLAMARSFGIEIELITPSEAGKLYPLLRTDDLTGAVWLPGDGKANPTDLTQSLAKGARNGGARLIEGVKVTGFDIRKGRAVGVKTNQGDIACEVVVNCGGQWAREIGKLAGVNVPLFSAEHFYIVTKKIPGVTPDLPVMRDPDGFIYYKEEVGGLVMGGFEPVAKPWAVDPIPDNFEFQLLPEDWDQFQPLMENALHRTPCLETAEIRQLLNGPESFTSDGNFILGESPEIAGFFVAAGFNSAGIANAGGAGRLTAEWIVGGEPSADLWDVDIRRFAPFTANRRFLTERTVETLGLHYAMRWPRHELETVRPLRTSPLYDLLAAKGAEFGSRNGWERANYFKASAATSRPDHTLGRPGWLPGMIEEQRATRETVALYDQSSFSKLLLAGRDALAMLQRLCAKNMDVPVNRMVYTALLNERGGFESDVTVIRQQPNAMGERYLIVTGSAQTVRDFDWIARHIQPQEHAILTDITPLYSVLSLMGPNAQALLARLCPDDLSATGLKFSWTRLIDLGHARVRAARMSYVGGPGYELYVPVEMTRHVYLALQDAGADLGLRDAGYYALDALRIERGRRAWGAELGPDETPFEAGMMAAVDLDKPGGFIGRDALLARQGQPLRKKLVTLVVDSPGHYLWGGESIWVNGQAAGEISSAGWSPAAGACMALGYVRGELANLVLTGTVAELDLWGERITARLYDQLPAAGL